MNKLLIGLLIICIIIIAFLLGKHQSVNLGLIGMKPLAIKPTIEPNFILSMVPEDEIDTALNIYRAAHGLSKLIVNQELCSYANKRINQLIAINKDFYKTNEYTHVNMNHDGISADVNSGNIKNYIHGKWDYGENIASARCKNPTDGIVSNITSGTQLIDECWDASPAHKENMVFPNWTDVCTEGKYPLYVQIFAR